MEYSENFNFALPSRDNDFDLADINELANNFRKVDEKVVRKEDIAQSYDPKSEKPISAKGVAQALENVKIDVDDEMSDTSTKPVQNKVAKAYVDETKQELVNITDVLNLFNIPNAVDGKRIGTNGANYSDSNYFVSEYIPIVNGKTYHKNSILEDLYHRYAIYDVNKSFISDGTENTFTINNENAYYVRFCGTLAEKQNAVLYSDRIANDKIARTEIERLENDVLGVKSVVEGTFSTTTNTLQDNIKANVTYNITFSSKKSALVTIAIGNDTTTFEKVFEGSVVGGEINNIQYTPTQDATHWKLYRVNSINVSHYTGGAFDKLISNVQKHNSPLYVATRFGLSTENSGIDNTNALQDLMNNISAKGGGTIYIPSGIYDFARKSTKGCVTPKSNVSVVGENIGTTILRQTDLSSLFYFIGSAESPIENCTYSNFTVDGYDAGDESQVYGKAFFYQYVKHCVFRDLILKGTIATALGIDFIDNCEINNVTCIDCGRSYETSGIGRAGIGIGTGGGWENENFKVTNCLCIGCGHFGIFVEDQGLFDTPNVNNFPKGQIIANNICRNGKNYGIGCRGSRYVNIVGNTVYENTRGGIYLDFGADAVNISSNIISNEICGVNFGSEARAKQCSRVAIHGNTFVECENAVVYDFAPEENCVVDNNIIIS